MNGQDIFESLEYLDDQYIMEVQQYVKAGKVKKRTHYSFYKVVAAAAIVMFIAISGTIFFFNFSKSGEKKIVANFEN